MFAATNRDKPMDNGELQAAIDNTAARLKEFPSRTEVAHHALSAHLQKLLYEQRRRAGIIG